MFSTKAQVKCQIIDPDSKQLLAAKASIAALIKSDSSIKQSDFIKYASEHKQEDLLYFKAVYATCGFNLNDDVFIKDEFWKARTTPIWKPTDWQHDANDIIGVIYAVQAQDLNAKPLNIESNETPTTDFEIVVYGAIYKYMFPELAKEIKTRSDANELYVSMETWFNDFSYAFLEDDKGTILLVDRNDKTIALDKSLRAYGGVGNHDGKRIGRVLRGMTFGGMGIVNFPANPRSAATTGSEHIMESTMATEVVMKDLPEYKAMAEVAAKVPVLEKALAESKENADRLNKKLELAEQAKKLADAIIAATDNALASITKNPPPEIARIDEAKSAEEAFKAKLAYVAQTGKAFADELGKKVAELETLRAESVQKETELQKLRDAHKVTREESDVQKARDAEKVKEKETEVEKLRKRNAELETVFAEQEKEKAKKAKELQDMKRKEEVKALFNDAKIADALASNYIELDDSAYNKWLEEKKVIAGSVTLKKDGNQGSPEEEGKSGESRVKGEPRDKVSVASVLENAVVEAHVTPTAPAVTGTESFGFDALLTKKEATKAAKK